MPRFARTREHRSHPGWGRILALGQGAYYATTGVWPLLSMPSFERVTGPKVDRWLVKTVGALIAVIGTSLLRTGTRGRGLAEARRLASSSAAVLALVDINYVARRRIAPIYLLDAIVEIALLTTWMAVGRRGPRSDDAGGRRAPNAGEGRASMASPTRAR